jgi:hypothetical protein
MRIPLPRVAAIAATVLLLAGPCAAAGRRHEPAFVPTKEELTASYKPHEVQGVPWFEGVGAARASELRKKRAPGKERLIVEVRMLGPMDGAT